MASITAPREGDWSVAQVRSAFSRIGTSAFGPLATFRVARKRHPQRGFDFLGYHFSPTGLSVAKRTIANFIEKVSRLYEQTCHAGSAATAFEMYVRRWLRWANGGYVIPQAVAARTEGAGAFVGGRGWRLANHYESNVIEYAELYFA